MRQVSQDILADLVDGWVVVDEMVVIGGDHGVASGRVDSGGGGDTGWVVRSGEWRLAVDVDDGQGLVVILQDGDISSLALAV